jgi:hypothetical protein
MTTYRFSVQDRPNERASYISQEYKSKAQAINKMSRYNEKGMTVSLYRNTEKIYSKYFY